MRNLQRSLSILGGFAGASLMASALIVGCSGDDVNPADGGKDSATDTSVSWSEGGVIGTRNGNEISVNGSASRQSPPGCPNNTIHTSCVGSAPFVFVP